MAVIIVMQLVGMLFQVSSVQYVLCFVILTTCEQFCIVTIG